MNGKRIRITGVVQGVGFRPFVYNAARRLGIRGTVLNDAAGVDIHAAGERLAEFIDVLRNQPPPLARITGFDVTATEVAAADFTIIASEGKGTRQVDIAVDTRTCDDCLTEFNDPADRRYRYPFINCTNCGPRYTIIRDVPYDRPFTSMAAFPMCPECEREYRDPASRRFHAQPNCCPVCGPTYSNDIRQAAALIKAGRIVAVKGIGGFHLACDAFIDAPVERIRALKERDEKPFAVMAVSADLLKLTPDERRLIEGLERPIVLIDKTRAPLVSPGVAPGLDTLGVMLPYAPIHHLLFSEGGFKMLVMTSGNRKGAPMVIDNPEPQLGDIADFILDHNRAIVVRNDDSVIRELAGAPVFLRRSRGYAPAPVDVAVNVSGLLACGAMLKNSVAVGRGTGAYLSQYIGDLENEATYEALAFTARHLLRMFDVELKAAVCDLHPDYLSTRFAESLDVPVIKVQHHAAHALACMAENGVSEALAVVYDGVGFGTDGQAWGGELFAVRGADAVREAHLGYMPMPGGDACVEHPLRLAAAVLFNQGITLPGMEAVYEMLGKAVNVPFTSGMGRLFDAASALLGICTHQTYEGQAPMMLEAAAVRDVRDHYEVEGLDPAAILAALYRDPAPPAVRAAKVHNTVVQLTAREVRAAAGRTGLDTVCFTGGCFQNVLLLEGMLKALGTDFKVCRHRLVPPNDGGIALGQLVAAGGRGEN